MDALKIFDKTSDESFIIFLFLLSSLKFQINMLTFTEMVFFVLTTFKRRGWDQQ